MFESVDMPDDKEAFYQLLCKQAEALMSGETDTLANLANIASLLFTTMPAINWAGFYIARGNELVLGPFMGKPACVRIPSGRGVCGTAFSEKVIQRVDDVDAFPGHIACDAASQSEIVLPLITDDTVVAVLDIDSPNKSRFDQRDQQGLEALVETLEKQIDFTQLAY